MYCQNCGKEASSVGKFCEFCGKETGFTNNDGVKVPSTSNIKLSKKQKVIIGAACIVLVLGVILYQLGASLSRPEAVAEKYFASLAKADYEKAYKFLSLPQSEFLTKESYVKYSQEKYGTSAWIATFEIPEEKSYDKDTNRVRKEDSLFKSVNISYIKKGDSYPDYMTLQVAKSGSKKYLLFDEWKVTPGDIIQEEWLISVPKGAVLFIDGKEVKKENIIKEQAVNWFEDNDDHARYEVYSVKKVFPCKHEVKVTMQNGKETVQTLASQETTIKIVPDDTLEKMVKDIIKKHNENWAAAMNTLDINHMKETVIENSEAWQNILSAINDRKNYSSTKFTETLISLEFDEIYLDDVSHLRVETSEKWKTVRTDNYGSYPYDSNPNWVYLLKKHNDKWLVYKVRRK